MIIKYTQSGGFAGLRRQCLLDTDAMPADEVSIVGQLIESTGIMRQTSQLSSRACDACKYSIAVEDAGTSHLVEFDDTTIPHAMRPLIEFLHERSEVACQ